MGKYTIIILEIIHLGLAIVDLWSDANLLLEIQDTQEKYEDNQEAVDEAIESNQYTFGECLLPNSMSGWENETITYCGCDQFDVTCNEGEIAIEEINLFTNITNINPTMDTNEYIEIAEKYTTCTDDNNDNNIATEWECNLCDCIGNEYGKQQSIPLQQAIQEYNLLNDTQLQYCDPNELLTDEYNEYLDNIIIVAWTFLILGSLIQCCAVCGRWYLAAMKICDPDAGENFLEITAGKMFITWMVCDLL